MQGGLTDLWLDDPYVLAAKKLLQWATEENEKGGVYPVSSLFPAQMYQTTFNSDVPFFLSHKLVTGSMYGATVVFACMLCWLAFGAGRFYQ